MKYLISIKHWFIKNFICKTIFSDGHISEPYLHETIFAIHTKRCSRCHSILGLGKWKAFRNCQPPNSSKKWEEYFDNSLEELRQSIKNKL